MSDNPPEPDPTTDKDSKKGDKAVENPTAMKFCNKCPFQTLSLSAMRDHNRMHLTTEEAAEDKTKPMTSEKTEPGHSKVREN